jgi:hypothetical protein
VAAEDRGAVVVDCALLAGQSSREWLAAARHRIAGRAQSTVVLAHLASLDERTAGSLAAILDDAAGEDLHVVGTSAASATIPQAIRDRFMLECIEFPPLRRRPHDVRSRIDEQPFGAPRLSQRALNLALRHPWPGNDRQLESFVAWLRTQQRAFVDVDELPAEWRASAHRHGATALQQAESETIAAALRENGGNKAVSAKALGISRSSLYRKMREYHLE